MVPAGIRLVTPAIEVYSCIIEKISVLAHVVYDLENGLKSVLNGPKSPEQFFFILTVEFLPKSNQFYFLKQAFCFFKTQLYQPELSLTYLVPRLQSKLYLKIF